MVATGPLWIRLQNSPIRKRSIIRCPCKIKRPGEHTIAVRVTDEFDNVAVEKITVR